MADFRIYNRSLSNGDVMVMQSSGPLSSTFPDSHIHRILLLASDPAIDARGAGSSIKAPLVNHTMGTVNIPVWLSCAGPGLYLASIVILNVPMSSLSTAKVVRPSIYLIIFMFRSVR